MWGLIFLAGIATFAAGLVTVFIVFANGMRASPGAFVGRGFIWLAWIIAAVLWVASGITAASAHDQHRPERNEWLKGLFSKNKTWCCNGDDYDQFDDWEAREGGYRVKFRGQWFDVPDGAVIGEPNRIGEALLWMNKGISGFSVRCFLPGALT